MGMHRVRFCSQRNVGTPPASDASFADRLRYDCPAVHFRVFCRQRLHAAERRWRLVPLSAGCTPRVLVKALQRLRKWKIASRCILPCSHPRCRISQPPGSTPVTILGLLVVLSKWTHLFLYQGRESLSMSSPRVQFVVGNCQGS